MYAVKLAKPLALQWLIRTVICLTVYLVLLLGLHFFLGSLQQQRQLEAIPQQIRQQFMPVLAQSVWDVDTGMMRTLLQGMLALDGVAQATLLNPKGEIQMQMGSPQLVSHQLELPIVAEAAGQQALGALRLGLSLRKLEQQQWQHLGILFGELLGGLLLAGLLSYRFLRRQISQPLLNLAAQWQTNEQAGNANDELALMRTAVDSQQQQQQRQAISLLQERNELGQQREHLSGLLAMRTAELEQLTRFHQLIAELSSRLAQLGLHNLQGEIAIALARIGTLLDVDRCYLFRVSPALRIHQTQEWCRSGIHSTAHLYENYPLQDSAWFVPQLLKQHLVALSQLDDMPPEGQTERLRFHNHGIQSLAVVTLSYQGQVLGFFGCDTVLQKRDWQDKELTLMRLFSEMLSTVLLQQQCQTELEQTRQQLSSAHDKLSNMANVDGLTGLANQKALLQQLSNAFRHAQQQSRPLAVLQVDVDLLRDYNDYFGFAEGDQCLIRLAGLLQQHFPTRGSLVARSGGDRFTVLLPGVDQPTSLALADNLRLAVWQLAIPHPASPVSTCVTVSIGACSYDAAQHPVLEDLLQHSEQCLQHAKQQGRNRVAGHAANPAPSA